MAEQQELPKLSELTGNNPEFKEVLPTMLKSSDRMISRKL
jgi:hypothetical protein